MTVILLRSPAAGPMFPAHVRVGSVVSIDALVSVSLAIEAILVTVLSAVTVADAYASRANSRSVRDVRRKRMLNEVSLYYHQEQEPDHNAQAL